MSLKHKISSTFHFYFKSKTIYRIHSPFVYDFVNNVFDTSRYYYVFDKIEQIRWSLKQSKDEIIFEDYGAKKKKPRKRKVADIAKAAVSGKHKCRWLFNTALRYESKNILELGTSLGISSLYLASAKSDAQLYTLEGDPKSAEIAQSNFKRNGHKNIELIQGRFDDTLSSTLQKMPSLDLAYIDGNHSYQGTMDYFHECLKHHHSQSIFIFDDLYWSEEMTKAWTEIKAHPSVKLSIDLFQIGYVFFDPAIKEKQHFKIVHSKWKIWQKYLP